MRVKNSTTFDTSYLRKLAVAVKPERCTKVEVVFKHFSQIHVAGQAWNDVLIKVPRLWGVFPYQYKEGDGYLGVMVYTREEELVYVLAHEFRHVWQSLVPRGWRVWGAGKSGASERDADAYGLQMLRRYRRGELKM